MVQPPYLSFESVKRSYKNTNAIGLSSAANWEFVEEKPGIEQHCHSEPVRTLVWESPSNSRQPIVIQSVLSCRFPEFIHEKWYVYSGDCHASVITGSQ